MNNYPDDDTDVEKSKSQVKRDMNELQDIGVQLTDASKSFLDQLKLPEKLYEAILEYKKISSNIALKRQRQYIGKLMRTADFENIRAKIAGLTEEKHRQSRQLHAVEHWRDRLINGSSPELEALINQYPHVDRQQLRQLQSAAKRDHQKQKNTGAARKLFKLLQVTLSVNVDGSLLD